MTEAWRRLGRELEIWEASERPATFWLRDDDAETVTPALKRLLEIGGGVGIPVCLAVIPKNAGPALGTLACEFGEVRIVQHGWCHANHAGPDEKKFELGDHRPARAVGDDLAKGDARLRQLFGSRHLKVLAPPWNRIGPGIAGNLADWGYRGLSVFGPRSRSVAAEGVVRVNTHVDIIDWKNTRGFLGAGPCVEQAVAHLGARRSGTEDRQEPTGLITHHLVHDEACWAFIEDFIAFTLRFSCVRWLDAGDVFNPVAQR